MEASVYLYFKTFTEILFMSQEKAAYYGYKGKSSHHIYNKTITFLSIFNNVIKPKNVFYIFFVDLSAFAFVHTILRIGLSNLIAVFTIVSRQAELHQSLSLQKKITYHFKIRMLFDKIVLNNYFIELDKTLLLTFKYCF